MVKRRLTLSIDDAISDAIKQKYPEFTLGQIVETYFVSLISGKTPECFAELKEARSASFSSVTDSANKVAEKVNEEVNKQVQSENEIERKIIELEPVKQEWRRLFRLDHDLRAKIDDKDDGFVYPKLQEIKVDLQEALPMYSWNSIVAWLRDERDIGKPDKVKDDEAYGQI